MHLKRSSGKWQPFRLGLSVLKIGHQDSSPSTGLQYNMSRLCHIAACNIRRLLQYRILPQRHFCLKSREVLFAHKSFLNCLIVLVFCAEHDSDAVVLCAKYQTDWATGMEVIDERGFARFEFKTSFGGICNIATFLMAPDITRPTVRTGYPNI